MKTVELDKVQFLKQEEITETDFVKGTDFWPNYGSSLSYVKPGSNTKSWYLLLTPHTDTYFHIESLFKYSIGFPSLSTKMSTVSEACVSCAEEQFVTGLHGIPSVLATVIVIHNNEFSKNILNISTNAYSSLKLQQKPNIDQTSRAF